MLYITLALVLSVFVSLFWLVVVVGIHFTLELVRQHYHCSKSTKKVLGRSLWHLKLDLSFIAFSFVISAYMGVLFGLAGLGKISRVGRIGEAEISSGARLGGYERVIRGVLLSSDDLARTTSAAVGRRDSTKNNEKDDVSGYHDVEDSDPRTPVISDSGQPLARPDLTSQDSGVQVRWRRRDYATVAFGITCVALLLLTPWLIQMTYEELLQIIMHDLQPFPV